MARAGDFKTVMANRRRIRMGLISGLIRTAGFASVELRPAWGDALGINFYVLSYHLDREQVRQKDFREINPGLGLHYVFSESDKHLWFADAGFFKDSSGNTAKLVLGGYRYKFSDRWHLGAGLGPVQSDSYERGKPFVALLPVLSYRIQSAAFNLTFIPKSGPNQSAVFGFYVTVFPGELATREPR